MNVIAKIKQNAFLHKKSMESLFKGDSDMIKNLLSIFIISEKLDET